MLKGWFTLTTSGSGWKWGGRKPPNTPNLAWISLSPDFQPPSWGGHPHISNTIIIIDDNDVSVFEQVFWPASLHRWGAAVRGSKEVKMASMWGHPEVAGGKPLLKEWCAMHKRWLSTWGGEYPWCDFAVEKLLFSAWNETRKAVQAADVHPKLNRLSRWSTEYNVVGVVATVTICLPQ